jgi:hypothetical protein
MSQENPPDKQPWIGCVNRQQPMSWRAVDVEHPIGEDRPARTIWALVGPLDLSAFYQRHREQRGGRGAASVRLFGEMKILWLPNLRNV